jgi:hypothetical protein
LSPGEPGLVDSDAVDLDGDATREENLHFHLLNGLLLRSCRDLKALFLASPRGIVDRMLQCDCGFKACAEHEDELVAEVQRHAWEAHGMALSRDEALLLAFRVQLGALPTISRQTANPPDQEGL